MNCPNCEGHNLTASIPYDKTAAWDEVSQSWVYFILDDHVTDKAQITCSDCGHEFYEWIEEVQP